MSLYMYFRMIKDITASAVFTIFVSISGSTSLTSGSPGNFLISFSGIRWVFRMISSLSFAVFLISGNALVMKSLYIKLSDSFNGFVAVMQREVKIFIWRDILCLPVLI